jgi:hypothetical protein
MSKGEAMSKGEPSRDEFDHRPIGHRPIGHRQHLGLDARRRCRRASRRETNSTIDPSAIDNIWGLMPAGDVEGRAVE